jgi:putative membrane protein
VTRGAVGQPLAHAADGADWPVLPLALLVLAALGYLWLLARTAPRRRTPWTAVGPAAAWLGGLAALGAALASPLERLAEDSLTAHMVQHLLLTIVAAPLLVLADPVPRIARVLPAPARPALVRPWASLVRLARRPAAVLGAAVTYLAVVLAWHLPGAYEAAVRSTPVHVVEHLTLFSAAVLLWWSVLRVPRRRLDQLVGALVAVLIPAFGEAALGGVMMLSSTPWYDVYVLRAAEHELDPLRDQQVAGAVMWAAGTPVYLLAAVILLWRLLRAAPEGQEAPVQPAPDTPRRVTTVG